MNEPRRRGSTRPRGGSSTIESGHAGEPSAGPSGGQLIKATIVAIIVAAVILVVAVLPAEYGIDPTGVGEVLGLMNMAAADEIDAAGSHAQSAEQSADSADVVAKTDAALRTDSLSVTLQPGEGAEVKVKMEAGERMVFEWVSTGGPVNFDMHGEKPNDGDKFTSYWADEQKESAAGVFVAPMDGTHGWFWRNRSEGPVEVTVKVSGFFEELYRVK